MARSRPKPSGCSAILLRSSAAPPSGRSAGSTVRDLLRAPANTAPQSPIRRSWRNGRPRWRIERSMSTLLCFGLGYCAEHYVAMFGDGFAGIVGTVRGAERAAVLNARLAGRLKALVFDGKSATGELVHAIGEADAALISIPQDEIGDPVLRVFGDALAHARRL